MAAGTKQDPWLLKTPPGASCYSTCKDPQASPPALVCQAGPTTLKYHPRAIKGRTRGLASRTAGFPSPRPMFGISLPPIPEELGLAELTHLTRNNQIRSIREQGNEL